MKEFGLFGLEFYIHLITNCIINKLSNCYFCWCSKAYSIYMYSAKWWRKSLQHLFDEDVLHSPFGKISYLSHLINWVYISMSIQDTWWWDDNKVYALHLCRPQLLWLVRMKYNIIEPDRSNIHYKYKFKMQHSVFAIQHVLGFPC